MSQVLAFIGGEDATLDDAAVERAVAGVSAAIAQTRRLSSYDRAAILDKVVLSLKADAHAIVEEMTDESGCLTRRDSRLDGRPCGPLRGHPADGSVSNQRSVG